MIEIRPATGKDAAAIAEVNRSAAVSRRRIYRPRGNTLAAKARIEGNLIRLVVVAQGRIVGTVEYEVKGDVLSVVGLDVHADFRKQGIARGLMADLANKGRCRKVRILSLYAVKETGNVPIFEKLGFQVVSERVDELFESDLFDSLTEVRMERRL